MKVIRLMFIFLWLCAVESQAQGKRDTLLNTTVIELHTAGLSSDIIKSKIQSTVCAFDLSTDALIALKKGGVSDDVVTAMITKTTQSAHAPADTASPILPGIYYCKGTPCALTELEASVYSQTKSGSGMLTALSYGIAKTKMKSTLSGSEANLQIEEKSPVFYFYFDPGSSNNFGTTEGHPFWFTSVSSPNEFLLVKFAITKKSREVVTGSWNEYAGISSGIDDKNKVAFKYEKLSKGVYKVYFEKPLKSGEYSFMYAGSSGGANGGAPLQKVYDFGIQ
jgi:hypothetical protein